MVAKEEEEEDVQLRRSKSLPKVPKKLTWELLFFSSYTCCVEMKKNPVSITSY